MIYLSGPITHSDPLKQRANLDRLNQKARELREQGIEVFNPGELETDGKDWSWYLARDLHWIILNHPNILFLKGWEESRGCRLEYQMALLLDLPISYE